MRNVKAAWDEVTQSHVNAWQVQKVIHSPFDVCKRQIAKLHPLLHHMRGRNQ